MAPPASGGRRSAVLILFGEGPAGPDVLLVQRSPWLRRHAGQPAFPGGAIDPQDGGPVAAALREAAEEALVDPAGVDVLAVLPDLYIPRSGFAVTPVLAWWRQPGPIGPGDPAEVTAVRRVPVAELADPANRLSVRYPTGPAGPAFQAGRHARSGGSPAWSWTGCWPWAAGRCPGTPRRSRRCRRARCPRPAVIRGPAREPRRADPGANLALGQ